MHISVISSSLHAYIPQLAQGNRLTTQQSIEVFKWIGIIIVAAIILGIIAAFIRKMYYRDNSSGGVGYTLGDLRELHKKGELSDEEFNAAKSLIIAQGKAALQDSPDSQESDNWNNISPETSQKVEDFELGKELLDVDEDHDQENSEDSSDKNPPEG
ncbi:SHOCT domain-containing protein [Planctomycetota bacterium]|nr:SHOCT domain-containing protein [Planctomycetota bacterium]